MNPISKNFANTSRAAFSLGRFAPVGHGRAGLVGDERLWRGTSSASSTASAGLSSQALTHFAPKAKQVIYLHMVGGPSQMDLFDYKPVMNEWFDKDLPESVRMGQRLTTMTSGQARFPIAPSKYKFERCGQSGMWISELMPWLKKIGRRLVFIRSMHTEAINHEPAITLMQTGNQVTGRPCLGAWASYGLGALNDNLPTFVVMVAQQLEHRTSAGDLGAAVVERISAGPTRGRQLPHRGRSDSVHQRSAGRAARCPPRQPRWAQRAERAQLSSNSAIRKRKRAFSSTSSRIACKPACRS